jgi:hypothetical protein
VFSSCFLQKFGSGPRGGWQSVTTTSQPEAQHSF